MKYDDVEFPRLLHICILLITKIVDNSLMVQDNLILKVHVHI